MIENAGCKLLYLPTYSPDLNPIENYWAVMKKMIRKIRDQYENIGEAMDVVLQNNKRYFNS
jgi:transposase